MCLSVTKATPGRLRSVTRLRLHLSNICFQAGCTCRFDFCQSTGLCSAGPFFRGEVPAWEANKQPLQRIPCCLKDWTRFWKVNLQKKAELNITNLGTGRGNGTVLVRMAGFKCCPQQSCCAQKLHAINLKTCTRHLGFHVDLLLGPQSSLCSTFQKK